MDSNRLVEKKFVFPLNATVKDLMDLGEKQHADYTTAEPFPHIKIDNFLDDGLLDQVLNEVTGLPQAPESNFNRAQERLKVSFNPDTLPETSRNLFRTFNSRPFVAYLEKLTGIRGLIPDPFFLGGGIHEVKNGGHLDIHADFNYHTFLKVERRINVLIYLNKEWEESYGGQFEIWDSEMTRCVKTFNPIFNRCVIFNTTSDSFHGNPKPVAHPDGVSRYSIALYYYTATWDGTKRDHTTQFKVRPKSKDRFDWKIKTNEFLHELTPPILVRLARKVRNKVYR